MKLFFLVLIVGCAMAMALPAKTYYKRYAQRARLQQAAFVRPRRAPLALARPLHRTMLISGYYRPLFTAQRRQAYEPETAMTAFATGDSVAAGSYLGTRVPNCVACDQVEQQQQQDVYPEAPLAPQYDQPQSDEALTEGVVPAPVPVPVSVPISDEEADAELAPAPAPVAPPKRKTNKKLKQPAVVVEADESSEVGEEQDAPLVPARRGNGATYFPIMFSGGYPGRSSGSGGSGGGVTAIANAYSTGKGGVATSHATAYGSGAPRSKKSKNGEYPPDEED